MKRKTFFGLSAAAMLMVAPNASAAYWTGHGEFLKDLIENWILNHSTVAPKGNTVKQAERAPATKHATPRTPDARR